LLFAPEAKVKSPKNTDLARRIVSRRALASEKSDVDTGLLFFIRTSESKILLISPEVVPTIFDFDLAIW
jgi:hypothetical protein